MTRLGATLTGIGFAVALAIVLPGCKDSPTDKPAAGSAALPAAVSAVPPPPPPTPAAPTSEALATSLRVADGVCACADAACAAKVVADNREAVAKLRGYQPSSEEEGNALMTASKRMADCAARIPTDR